jgi:hypothetical protein
MVAVHDGALRARSLTLAALLLATLTLAALLLTTLTLASRWTNV